MGNHIIKDIVQRCKGSLIIRFLCWPYMTVKKYIQKNMYARSEEPSKIERFKDVHKGKRCFIIGNGPSLIVEDLEAIQNEITIGSNRIYKIFDKTKWRPTYYMAEDPDGIAEMMPHIKGSGVGTCILSTAAKKYVDYLDGNIVFGYWTSNRFVVNRYNDCSSHISEDVSKYFSTGYTVTFSAIQLAIYMGIKEIYLLGVDFNYSVVADKKGRMMRLDGVRTYFDGKERNGSYLNYYSTLYAYEHAREYCDSHDIRIYNSTRGGKLEVFERIDFDALIGRIALE